MSHVCYNLQWEFNVAAIAITVNSDMTNKIWCSIYDNEKYRIIKTNRLYTVYTFYSIFPAACLLFKLTEMRFLLKALIPQPGFPKNNYIIYWSELPIIHPISMIRHIHLKKCCFPSRLHSHLISVTKLLTLVSHKPTVLKPIYSSLEMGRMVLLTF